MKYLIGVDLGTTNAKGVLYDVEGNKIASAIETYTTEHLYADYAEQDPMDWWKAVTNIFQALMKDVDETVKHSVISISVSSQTPTLLPLNAQGDVLRKAIIWMDSRAEKQLEEILNRIGEQEYIRLTGMLPAVSFLPPKLRWFKEHEGDLWDETSCFLQANGYINYRLTGVLSVDRDQASLTQCLDTKTGRWSEEMGEIIGIRLEDYMPQPVSNTTIIGHVTEAAAEETGLKPGIPVVAGTSDAIAAMYASGLSKMGEATEVAGTSSLVFAGTTKLPDTYPTVSGHPCAIEGIPYVFNAPITATGASIKWYLDNFGLYEEELSKKNNRSLYDNLNELAQNSEPGSGGILFFPYMMGERAPLWNNHAKGMFIGMSMKSKRKDMVRALFEGTSFALRTVLDECRKNGAEIESLRVVGGGAKSETWMDIKASVLGIPVYVLDDKTGDVPFGDALIAGLGVGVFQNLKETSQSMIRIKKVYYPNSAWKKRYDRLYPFFKKMYEDLDGTLKRYNVAIEE